MHEFAKKIAESLKAKCESIGIENIDKCKLEELGAWTDILKDLTEYDINIRAIEAMDEESNIEEIEMMLNNRMGYRGRGTDGRFVHRTGRGRSAGYRPLLHKPYYDDDYEYGYDYPSSANYRMGYHTSYSNGDTRTDDNGIIQTSSRYGRSYDKYDENRRHYHSSNDAESKRRMDESAAEVFDDMESMITDVVREMTPEQKNKYKAKLTQMAQKIQ